MKIHHRGTEEGDVSLAGSPAFQRDRPLAREKSFIVDLKTRFSGKDGWSLLQKFCG